LPSPSTKIYAPNDPSLKNPTPATLIRAQYAANQPGQLRNLFLMQEWIDDALVKSAPVERIVAEIHVRLCDVDF
jgi:hypothetical protein